MQPSRTDLSRGGPEGNSRRRSVSQPESPSHSKSVSFDLDGNTKADKGKSHTHDTAAYGEGYETDDSDSTIDGNDRNHHRHHHHRHPPPPLRDHLSNSYEPTPNTNRHHHHHHRQTPKSNAVSTRSTTKDSSDSEATIDLPDRFDAQGRKLPEEGDDLLADSVEHLLQNIFSTGRQERSANKV